MIDSETKSKNKAETMGMDNGESTNIYVPQSSPPTNDTFPIAILERVTPRLRTPTFGPSQGWSCKVFGAMEETVAHHRRCAVCGLKILY